VGACGSCLDQGNPFGYGPRRQVFFRGHDESWSMETGESYFERKYEEIQLINSCLDTPRAVARPRTIEAMIEQKFRLSAALKAEHAFAAWAATETRWTDAAPLRAGPFEIEYGYQRADLMVRGPFPYTILEGLPGVLVRRVIYTSSGMAAVSALLMALGRLGGNLTLLLVSGSYKETLEVITAYGHHMRVIRAEGPHRRKAYTKCRRGDKQILFVDSSVPERCFRLDSGLLGCTEDLDLVVCDTTCFSADSGRIRRILHWAKRVCVPLVLVRSHTKLDSLGVEYGRLGSAVFVAFPDTVPLVKLGWYRDLAREMQDAVRLFGGAAIPAHFCPFADGPGYRQLNARRMAAMLRNCRALVRDLGANIGEHCLVGRYQHGLFATLSAPSAWTDDEANGQAEDLAKTLRARGLPVRHAGSFGFDFVAIAAFFDTKTDRHVLRVAAADLPSWLFAQIVDQVGAWWTHRWRTQAA
jgi:hypothetical protein